MHGQIMLPVILCLISMLSSFTDATDASGEVPISSGNLLREILESRDFTDVEKEILKYIIFSDVKDFVERKEASAESREDSDSGIERKRSHLWAYRQNNIPIQTRVAFGRQLMRNSNGHGSNSNLLRYGK
uniref:LRYamide n=1 Tax=Mizuhopecten yessoensis TaxID=6573 RepID=A0A346GAW7_MIZYE|nr:LRYamide [Mizuhopecten yessoensis]